MLEPFKFVKLDREPPKLEYIEVSEQEFIDMYIKHNIEELQLKAKLQVSYSKVLGSSIKIGDKMVKGKIKKEKDNEN